MEDFLIRFEQGLKGENRGIETGLSEFSKSIDNIQKETNYVIFGQPKTFKTKFTDSQFILYPFLNYDNSLLDITYYSFEVSRIKKTAEWIAFFFWHDYKLRYSASHVMSRGDNRIKDEHIKYVEIILKNRIVPLIGEYDKNGKRIKNGIVDFIEEKQNPTGIYQYLVSKAKSHGEIITEPYSTLDDKGNKITKSRVVGFNDREPDKYRLVICDHVRLLRRESKLSMKDNIDRYSEYTIELRNLYKYSFVDIIHSNRSLSDKERVTANSGNFLRPQLDDVKDSGRKKVKFVFYVWCHQSLLLYLCNN